MKAAPKTKKPRGFAVLSPEMRRRIAGLGGKRAHELGVAHEFTPEEARAAGAKGGRAVSVDTEHMREIGRRGGQNSHRSRTRKQA